MQKKERSVLIIKIRFLLEDLFAVPKPKSQIYITDLLVTARIVGFYMCTYMSIPVSELG